MPRYEGHIYKIQIADKTEGRFRCFIILAHDENHELRHVEIHASKTGSTIHGALSTLEQMINIALQAHEGLDLLIQEMEGQTFSPQGETDDPEIPYVKSVPHYLAERIKLDYRKPALIPSA